VGEGTGGDGKQQADEDEHRRYGYKDPSIQLLRRSYMHFWGKTKGEHIGWRNYQEWKAKCKNADIPDAPEASFRRWKKKEMAVFDCEPTKDTAESAPIRHPDQVLGLLEQVIRNREFARKPIAQHEPELQSTHIKVLHVLFVYCQPGIKNWRTTGRDRRTRRRRSNKIRFSRTMLKSLI
jgi:hypothetical protein